VCVANKFPRKTPWLTKERFAVTAPQRAMDDESGASWIGPWGKASLLLLIRHWPWTDASQEFPAFIAHSLEAELPQHLDGSGSRTWRPKYLIRRDASERRPVVVKCQQDFNKVVIIVGEGGCQMGGSFRRIIMAATQIWGAPRLCRPRGARRSFPASAQDLQ